jgi:hypothetical protein
MAGDDEPHVRVLDFKLTVRLSCMHMRIFLDSSVLQCLQSYGEFVYENVEPSATDRIHSIPHGYEELDALRAIFFIGKRAPFEIALSNNSFAEVQARGDSHYLGWAGEVLAYWEACLASYEQHAAFAGTGPGLAAVMEGPEFGYLGKKDRLLLQDAAALECEVFLTMDRKLEKNADHILRSTGLKVLLPSALWKRLSRPRPLQQSGVSA